MKSHSKPEKKNQGDFLRELYDWSGKKTQKDFAKEFRKSRDWYLKAIKYEIIPLKDKYDVCRAYNVPLEYFVGQFKLPNKLPALNEPQAEYLTPYKMLEEENRQLKIEKMELQTKYIDLLEKHNKLLEEKNIA